VNNMCMGTVSDKALGGREGMVKICLSDKISTNINLIY